MIRPIYLENYQLQNNGIGQVWLYEIIECKNRKGLHTRRHVSQGSV